MEGNLHLPHQLVRGCRLGCMLNEWGVTGNCQEVTRVCSNLKLSIVILTLLVFQTSNSVPSIPLQQKVNTFPFQCSNPIMLKYVSFCMDSNRRSTINNFVGQTSASSSAIIWLLHLLFPCQSQNNRMTCIQNAQAKNNNQLLAGQKGFMVYLSFLSMLPIKVALLSLPYFPLGHHLPWREMRAQFKSGEMHCP